MNLAGDRRGSRNRTRSRVAGYAVLFLILGVLPARFYAQSNSPAQGSSNSSASSASSAIPLNGGLSDTNIAPDFNTTNLSTGSETNPPDHPVTNSTDASGTGETNAAAPAVEATTGSNAPNATLSMAIYFGTTQQFEKAEPLLVRLLAGNVSETIQKAALFELATVVRGENDLPRAQSIYGQYLERWPADVKVPEILLRQGEIYREMGLNDLALGKFYSVMTAALSLKSDQLAYYQSLVLQTQVEIAETHYLIGQFSDAADFYSRLMLNTDPSLNRSQIQYRLIRSLSIIGRNDQTVAQAKDFIAHYPDSDQAPEVRYYLAESLKALGQNADALQEVLLCLRDQRGKTRNNPQTWAYWQQRVGNEIANQLYREGDYINALLVYTDLAQLNPSPDWQVPVDYQMGITYEKLSQPQKAVETYNTILARQTELGTNASAALQAVFDMAHWRLGFIQWQTNAEAVDHSLTQFTPAPVDLNTNLQTSNKP